MAYNFAQASSQYLSTTTSPVGAVPLTLACFFLETVSASSSVCLSVSTTTGDDRCQLALNGGSLRAQSIAAGVGDTVTASTSYTQGNWNHACAVFASNTSKVLYLNGASVGSSGATYNLATLSRIIIGGRLASSTVGAFYGGALAEVSIWNSALTAAEVASLAKGFTPDQVRPQSLVFYLDLIRELRDLRGGLTITATNSPTVANHPRVYQ